MRRVSIATMILTTCQYNLLYYYVICTYNNRQSLIRKKIRLVITAVRREMPIARHILIIMHTCIRDHCLILGCYRTPHSIPKNDRTRTVICTFKCTVQMMTNQKKNSNFFPKNPKNKIESGFDPCLIHYVLLAVTMSLYFWCYEFDCYQLLNDKLLKNFFLIQ